MRIWSPIVLAPVVGATVPPRYTIVSIESSNGVVDIDRLPDMLRKSGHTHDKEVALFLENAVIVGLKLVHMQVVKTSASTVDSNTLCNFVTEASRKLLLQAHCVEDVHGETLGDFDSELHVNDPIAYWQTHFKRMKMGEVWQAALPHVIRRPTVAVLDSGINWTDPDFAPLKGRVKKTSGGYLEGGWNFNTESSNLTTESSHGTHVCKVLAAKGNNSYGLVGIAPNVTLVPLQVVKIVKGKDTVPLVNFVAALNMAIDIKADIISMSVGFYPHQMTPSTLYLMWRALRSAQLAGILLVSSAGNKGVRALNKYPCWFGGPLGMCVANLLSNQTHNVLNPNSNWGERVDVAAYGTKIVVDGGKETLTITSGSSVAAPFATGISAILLSMGVKPGKVKPFIRMHTDPIYHPPNAGQPHTIRGGALNALKTAKFAINWLDSKPRELRSNDYLELEG